MFSILLVLLLHLGLCIANTEKAIFLGPSAINIAVDHPTLDDLQLDTLTPHHWSLRTHIKAEFPTIASKYGEASWLVLSGLSEGQRYEVRICWAATQPTSFRLDTYELQTVFETPELITSLAQYSEARQAQGRALEDLEPNASAELENPTQASHDGSSVLLLQIFAAADYFTMNQTLMKNVPPVYVDIILDPFLFNIFPRTLVPTAVYITIVAIGGLFLSKYIAQWILEVANTQDIAEKKKA